MPMTLLGSRCEGALELVVDGEGLEVVVDA